MNRTTLTALALAGFAMTPLARAVQVGELQSINGLGQPFEGFVPVMLGPDERLSAERVEIRPDSVSWSDPYQLDYLRGIEVEVVPGPGGMRYLRLVNRAPLQVPLLSFRVHLDAGRISFVRGFAVAPPAPVPMTADPGRLAVTGAMPAGADEEFGPSITVRPGQTLSGIARAVARERGGDWRAVMEQLHRNNPGAFIGGDIDRLIAGASLTLSGPVVETAALPAAPAPARNDTAEASAAVPAPARSGRSEYDPAVRELIATSTAKYAAIRARYATPATDLATAQSEVPMSEAAAPAVSAGAVSGIEEVAGAEPSPVAEGGPSAAAETGTSPAAAPTGAAAEAASAVDAGTLAAPSPATEEVIVPVAAEPNLAGMLVRLVAPLSLAAALGVGVWAFRRRRALASQRNDAAWAAAEAERRARVAEKARARSGDGRDRRTDNAEEAVQELDSTGDLVTFALQSIDDLIAHGRYESAEHDLKALISRAPGNWQALLRLSEIYYITENRLEFEQAAMELHSEHRAELPSDDWAKLMRMGRVLVPQNPLFGGPALVEARTA